MSDRARVLAMLEAASATNHPNIVWKSAACSYAGGPSVQAMVCRSSEGFHPGIRYEANRQCKTDWGNAMEKESEARMCAQGAAALWLDQRHQRRVTAVPSRGR